MNSQMNLASHVMAVLCHKVNQGAVTSDELAEGFGTNPVVIRRIISLLKEASLVESKAGVGGGSVLLKSPHEITMLDIYNAINLENKTNIVFAKYSSRCEVGLSLAPIISDLLDEISADAKKVLLKSLKKITLFQFTKKVSRKLKKAI